MQNLVKRGNMGSHEFCPPPNSSGTNKARKLKFGTYMDGSEYKRKKCKIRSKGVM